MKTLFTNGLVLVKEKEKYIAKNINLGVDGDSISYLGEEIPSGYEIKDMTGKLLMPGLVNAHGHAAMTLLRGVGSGLKLQDWLYNAIFPIEDKLTPEDVYIGTKWACMEMLASGTTAFSDMYFFYYEAAKAAEDAGMKINIGRLAQCFDPNLKAEEEPRYKEALEAVRLPSTPLIKYEYSIHSEYLSTDNLMIALAKDMELNRDKTLNIHVSETLSEHEECKKRHGGKTPVEYLDDLGILNNSTYMAHCIYTEEKDLEIMKKRGCTIVHNPSSNMKLGSGFAPIAKALSMDVNVALGTDGCASNNNLNMFEEMHLAALLAKGVTGDPTVLTADQVIDMATIGGAKALGRLDTGEIVLGKKADIIALDLNKPHLAPLYDIPALIVYSAQGSDVCFTMVNGKILYENGQFTTIDVEQLKKDFDKVTDRLLAK